MNAKLLVILLLSPFVAAFVYAAIHEHRRYRSQGTAKYGLVYDEETGTTHVTGIEEGAESYDPEDFDPDDFNRKAREAAAEEDAAVEESTAEDEKR